MAVTSAPRAPHDPLARVMAADSPVLIFEVDAAGIAQPAAPARRVGVRLIGCVRDNSDTPGRAPKKREVSAVLVLRELTPSRLLSCVRAVTRSGASIPPELLCQMLPQSQTDEAVAGSTDLVDRELDVLRLLADGETTREISERLNYSERTVKNIVHDLLAKLDCRTRAHAVATAARQGLI